MLKRRCGGILSVLVAGQLVNQEREFIMLRRQITFAAVTVYLVGLTGCSLTYDVSPGRVCPGGAVTVGTNNNGAKNTGIDVRPPSVPDITGAIPNGETERVVQIGVDTDFQITGDVPKLGGGMKRVDDTLRVDVVDDPFRSPLRFTWNGCIGSNAGTYQSLLDLALGDDIQVLGLANTSGRRIRLTHSGGPSVQLAPSERTTAFNGNVARGTWHVQLLDSASNEGCPPRDDTGRGSAGSGASVFRDPPPLTVDLTAGCP